MKELLELLEELGDRDGEIGTFGRACLLVAELGDLYSREALLQSAQLGYLLDCLGTSDEDA